jgi:hypothetical protein
MSDYSPFPRDRWKIELLVKDKSNFLSQNYHIIITIISKFGQFFLKWYENIYLSIILPQKKLDSFSKESPYMIHNWTHLS